MSNGCTGVCGKCGKTGLGCSCKGCETGYTYQGVTYCKDCFTKAVEEERSKHGSQSNNIFNANISGQTYQIRITGGSATIENK